MKINNTIVIFIRKVWLPGVAFLQQALFWNRVKRVLRWKWPNRYTDLTNCIQFDTIAVVKSFSVNIFVRKSNILVIILFSVTKRRQFLCVLDVLRTRGLTKVYFTYWHFFSVSHYKRKAFYVNRKVEDENQRDDFGSDFVRFCWQCFGWR